MPSIQNFDVIVPPTSGEVREQAIEAMRTNGVLKLVLLGRQDVPTPEPRSIDMRVLQTLQLEDEGLRIGGTDVAGDSIRVYADQDASVPASASIVFA